MAGGTIIVDLPDDRTKLGTIKLVNDKGQTVAGPFDCYGKADNRAAADNGNPSRDPTQPYGDTPLGNYSVPGQGVIATGDGTNYPANKYGSAGAIVLVPEDGDAKTAADNGRTGLMIHSGDLNADGDLRPTNGCIRVDEDDLKSLISGMDRLGGGPSCEAVKLDVEVEKAGGQDDGGDGADPPPGIADAIKYLDQQPHDDHDDEPPHDDHDDDHDDHDDQPHDDHDDQPHDDHDDHPHDDHDDHPHDDHDDHPHDDHDDHPHDDYDDAPFDDDGGD